jgi:hypothetical protein
MPTHITDPNIPTIQEVLAPPPNALPHGILVPPPRVREIVVKEKAKFAPAFADDDTWANMTDNLTLQHYFESLGYEVLYRHTPEGPEILAVGFDEMRNYVQGMSIEQQLKYRIWAP